MPLKEIIYDLVIFTPEVIKEAVDMLEASLPKNKRGSVHPTMRIELPSGEEWDHDNEDEFFADYYKGFSSATFVKMYINAEGNLRLSVYGKHTTVAVRMPSRSDVEKVFSVFESNVEKCRLPKQPQPKAKIKTDWITEAINKVEGRCNTVGRKLKLALTNLESEDKEEWQNALISIRDAWIELAKWLCQVNNIDTSDIQPDAVIDRLKKLKIDKTDERLFNLARASFNLYSKHHKRDIDIDTATACVISTIVSMQTVIREVFNAAGKDRGYRGDGAL